MRNSSHSPGCMRALPASQSCHVRRVEWMSEAAADCESPAASRAALISAADWFDVGPFGPRFGWLGTFAVGDDVAVIVEDGFEIFGIVGGYLNKCEVVLSVEPLDSVAPGALHSGGDGIDGTGAGVVGENDAVGLGHFMLQPLFPRRGVCDLLTIQIIHGFRAYASTFCGARSEPHNA